MGEPGEVRALLARLEAATGADRELDLEIWNLTNTHPSEWHPSFPPCTVVELNKYGDGAAGNPIFTLDEITGSLDGATMVCERLGLTWSKSFEGWVCVHSDETRTTHRPKGATLPLKLIAGALMHKIDALSAPPPTAGGPGAGTADGEEVIHGA